MFICMLSVFVISMLVVMFVSLIERKVKQVFSVVKNYGE